MKNTAILVLVLVLSACAETTPMMLTDGDGGVMPGDDANVMPGEDGGPVTDDGGPFPGEDGGIFPGEDGGPVTDDGGIFPGEDGGPVTVDAGTDAGRPGGVCGNRIREAGEECDAGAFGSSTCTMECTMICAAGMVYNGTLNGGAGACYGWTAIATEFSPCNGSAGELIAWSTVAEQHALATWLVATFGARTGNVDLSRGGPAAPWRWTRGTPVMVEWNATPEPTHNRGTLGSMGLRSRAGMSTTSWCMLRPEG